MQTTAFLYYPQESEGLQNRFQSHLKADKEQLEKIRLIHPLLNEQSGSDKRIEIEQYSVFDKWSGTQPNIIKVANVLNPQYFSPEQIQIALRNLHQILPDNGKLLIIENRKEEQSALFQKTEEGFELKDAVGPQIDIYQEFASMSAMR